MKILTQSLAIGCAGFVGAVARFLVANLAARLFGSGFPIGTLIINLSGSLFLGFFLKIAQDRYTFPNTLKLAIATGFVGAYTTFSTLMYESAELITDGAHVKAFTNLLASFILGMLAVWLGIVLARQT